MILIKVNDDVKLMPFPRIGGGDPAIVTKRLNEIDFSPHRRG